MPSVGLPSSISAMLTVNSPFLLMNSLVPSSGSTSQNGPPFSVGTRPAAISSSATTGVSGRQRPQAPDDDLLGGVVGIGHRALVGLGALAEVAGIDAHDLPRGGAGELAAGVAQRVMGRQGRGHAIGCFGGGDLITHSPMTERLLGVISALPEEFAHLSDRSGQAQEIGGFAFWRGEIAGREAVFVESGAGKVNAGVATSLLLDRFGCRALLMCGVAGGLDPALGVGDIVVGTSNTQHDYGVHRDAGFHTIQPGSRPSLGRRLDAGLHGGRRRGVAPARGGQRGSRWSRCRKRSVSAGACPPSISAPS